MRSTNLQPQNSTPTTKLLPLSSTKPNLVLAMAGSFYPIHNNHIRTLEKVKEHLNQSSEYHVIGGYIVPCHNDYVQQKLGHQIIDASKRLEMYQCAVADSEWIDIDPNALLQPKDIHSDEAILELESFLNQKLIRKGGHKEGEFSRIRVASVKGVDNLANVEKRLADFIWIIVQNRPSLSQIDIDAWRKSEKVKPYAHNITIVNDLDIPYEISSTQIREKIANGAVVDQYLPSKVSELFQTDPTFKNSFSKIASIKGSENWE